MQGHEPALLAHYGGEGLLERILAGLRAIGKDPDALTQKDLAPVDEFHTGGRRATRALAELAGLPACAPDLRVLDVGSGLGGPARFLAAQYGCDVTGLELVPEYCRAAEALSTRTGLGSRTRFRQGSALAMPFADAAFDLVWTIQAQMNIADKPRLYAEIARVLRPGGVFACQDLCAGDGRPLDFPVPWASAASHSFLITPPDLRALLAGLGLREEVWQDASATMLAWQEAHPPPDAAALPPLGMHLVLGPRHAEKRANAARALRDGRVVFIQGVFRKAA